MKKSVLKDSSLWVLLGSNLAMLFLALTQDWNTRSIMFALWLQLPIIGFLNSLKILTLKDEAYLSLILRERLSSLFSQRIAQALAFLIHYTLFCAVALVGIMKITQTDDWGLIFPEMEKVKLMGGIFFINHLFSFVYNFKKSRRDDINSVIVLPYLRVLPLILITFIAPYFLAMHKGIIFALFLLLKTLFDLTAHYFQHRIENIRQKDI